jgi:hypothetical protein
VLAELVGRHGRDALARDPAWVDNTLGGPALRAISGRQNSQELAGRKRIGNRLVPRSPANGGISQDGDVTNLSLATAFPSMFDNLVE